MITQNHILVFWIEKTYISHEHKILRYRKSYKLIIFIIKNLFKKLIILPLKNNYYAWVENKIKIYESRNSLFKYTTTDIHMLFFWTFMNVCERGWTWMNVDERGWMQIWSVNIQWMFIERSMNVDPHSSTFIYVHKS